MNECVGGFEWDSGFALKGYPGNHTIAGSTNGRRSAIAGS